MSDYFKEYGTEWQLINQTAIRAMKRGVCCSQRIGIGLHVGDVKHILYVHIHHTRVTSTTHSSRIA